MEERPILFSGPMVKALLAGTKTQTRRIMKPQPIPNGFGKPSEGTGWEIPCHCDSYPPSAMLWPDENGGMLNGDAGHPWFGVERLWVRETWLTTCGLDKIKPSNLAAGAPLEYLADGWRSDFGLRDKGKARASIFMCRWMSRITLEIIDVEAERLNDISEADAKAEGCVFDDWTYPQSFTPGKTSYRVLWESINGVGNWEKNPWIWKISFKKLESA